MRRGAAMMPRPCRCLSEMKTARMCFLLTMLVRYSIIYNNEIVPIRYRISPKNTARRAFYKSRAHANTEEGKIL